MRTLIAMLFAPVLALATQTGAQAASCEGVSFPDQTEVDGATLPLNGLGLREATIFNVSVYVAALYLESRTADAEQVIRAPGKKRLALKLVRDVDAEDMVGGLQAGMEKNAADRMPALEERMARFGRWLEDVPEGGTFAFTYRPGQGLEVDVNGKVKGTIEGDDFAQAFLAIWFGPKPPNTDLKTGLLGGACG